MLRMQIRKPVLKATRSGSDRIKRLLRSPQAASIQLPPLRTASPLASSVSVHCKQAPPCPKRRRERRRLRRTQPERARASVHRGTGNGPAQRSYPKETATLACRGQRPPTQRRSAGRTKRHGRRQTNHNRLSPRARRDRQQAGHRKSRRAPNPTGGDRFVGSLRDIERIDGW